MFGAFGYKGNQFLWILRLFFILMPFQFIIYLLKEIFYEFDLLIYFKKISHLIFNIFWKKKLIELLSELLKACILIIHQIQNVLFFNVLSFFPPIWYL